MEEVKFDSLEWHDAILHSIYIDTNDDHESTEVRFVVEWPICDYDENGTFDVNEEKMGKETEYNTIVFIHVIDIKLDMPCNIISPEYIDWATCDEITRKSQKPKYKYEYNQKIENEWSNKIIISYSNERVYRYTIRSYGTITVLAKGFEVLSGA